MNAPLSNELSFAVDPFAQQSYTDNIAGNDITQAEVGLEGYIITEAYNTDDVFPFKLLRFLKIVILKCIKNPPTSIFPFYE
jgi:hypothetical protein